MRSHVQKGTRKVGYVTISAHSVSESPSRLTTVLSGRKSSDGGTREVMKSATPKEAAAGKGRRGRGHRGRMPIRTERHVAAMRTVRRVAEQRPKQLALE